MEPKDQRKVDDFIIFAMCAARQALDDAAWHPASEDERCATGTNDWLLGSAASPASPTRRFFLASVDRAMVSPFFIPGRLINLASGYVSIEHGLKGPNHARGDRLLDRRTRDRRCKRLIALGDADVMVAGGTESPICRLSMAGFWSAHCRPAQR